MSAPSEAQAAGEHLLDRLSDPGDQAVPDEQAAKNLAALVERFKQAVAALKELRFAGADGAQRSAHELPWYALIGAPGAGNSALVRNSGLNFPDLLDEGEPQIVGVGGTRYCEWWFSDAAVLLDTAGRYVAHEAKGRSDVYAGTAAWHGFLESLRTHRPGRPLNGAIVTLSVTDLLLWSKPERQHFAAHVRMRLAELYSGLDVRFPVYLVLTKLDLLAGFAEFFEPLDAEGRAQVWGTTFALDADPITIGRTYESDFEVLQARLNAEMLARIEEEDDLARRAAIYRFPQQFHALGPLLVEFLGMAFSTLINHHPLMLRGVYFTSTSREGKPVDRVMRTLERAFKLPRRTVGATGPAGQSYFVERLVKDVILSEAALCVTGEPPGSHSPPFRLPKDLSA